MVRSGGRKLTGLGRRRMASTVVSGAAAVATGGVSTGVTRAAKVARMAAGARRTSAAYRQIRAGAGAPQGQSKIATAGMSAIAHAHNHVSALRGGMSAIAKQTRQGKDAPVRATTGHPTLDAAARRVGRAEAGAIKTHHAVKATGAKVAAPMVKGTKAVIKPVVLGVRKVTKPVRHVLTPPTATEVPRHVKPLRNLRSLRNLNRNPISRSNPGLPTDGGVDQRSPCVSAGEAPSNQRRAASDEGVSRDRRSKCRSTDPCGPGNVVSCRDCGATTVSRRRGPRRQLWRWRCRWGSLHRNCHRWRC